jgi:Predicted acetyltransferase
MTKIRSYVDEDFKEVRRILRDTELYNPEIDTEERFRHKANRSRGSILVAEEEQKVIGTVFITDDATNVLLTRLAVEPKNQDNGIGTDLVEAAEEKLIERDVPVSVAFAETGNKELKEWYRKRGYEAKGKYTMMWKELGQGSIDGN